MVTARRHAFVAGFIAYSGVLFIYDLFADISWLFLQVTTKTKKKQQRQKQQQQQQTNKEKLPK